MMEPKRNINTHNYAFDLTETTIRNRNWLAIGSFFKRRNGFMEFPYDK